MRKSSNVLREDTIIDIGKSISLGEYRSFFEKVGLDKDFLSSPNFYKWLNSHSRKMLTEASKLYFAPEEIKNMREILTEKRFAILSING